MINTLEPLRTFDSCILGCIQSNIKLASHQSGHGLRCCRVSWAWVEGNLLLLRHYQFTPSAGRCGCGPGPRLQMEY